MMMVVEQIDFSDMEPGELLLYMLLRLYSRILMEVTSTVVQYQPLQGIYHLQQLKYNLISLEVQAHSTFLVTSRIASLKNSELFQSFLFEKYKFIRILPSILPSLFL